MINKRLTSEDFRVDVNPLLQLPLGKTPLLIRNLQ